MDPDGDYYDIDYSKLHKYMQKPKDGIQYILQNPIGDVFYLDGLTQVGQNRMALPTEPVEEPGPEPIQTEVPIGWIGIYTVEDLSKIGKDSSYPTNGKYILMKNLNLNIAPYNTGEGWESISFSGNFDGNGLIIKNLYINKPTVSRVGFFTKVPNSSTITNLKLVNVNIVGYNYVGGLASDIEGRIIGVSVEGKVKGNNYVGMLSGESNYTTTNITQCYAKGSVEGSQFVGGLIGTALAPSYIQDSYTEVNVTGGQYTGGFIGYLIDGNHYLMIQRNYSKGTITKMYTQQIGGFIGYVQNNFNKIKITDCYYDNDIAQTSNGYGTPKTTSQMNQKSTYANWDFVNIWTISEGNDYPRLRWENR